MFVSSDRTSAAVLEQATDLGQGQSTAAGLGLRSAAGARRARPGTTPPALRPARLLAVVVIVAALFHGLHLPAEAAIRHSAFRAARLLAVCRPEHGLIVPAAAAPNSAASGTLAPGTSAPGTPASGTPAPDTLAPAIPAPDTALSTQPG